MSASQTVTQYCMFYILETRYFCTFVHLTAPHSVYSGLEQPHLVTISFGYYQQLTILELTWRPNSWPVAQFTFGFRGSLICQHSTLLALSESNRTCRARRLCFVVARCLTNTHDKWRKSFMIYLEPSTRRGRKFVLKW